MKIKNLLIIQLIQFIIFFIIQLFQPACSIIPAYSYKNRKITEKPVYYLGQNKNAKSGENIASINVPWNRTLLCKNENSPDNQECSSPDDKNFIALSISGGGSRSAIFSAAVMFELENHTLDISGNDKKRNLLQEIDVISSVSGGSLTAAYYGLSCDDDENCPETVEETRRNVWKPEKTFKNLSRSFQSRWIGNTFWPENLIRLWFTNYDRTDVFSETISDNLYDTSFTGGEPFRFQDLNPQRPNLIINASDNTEDIHVEDRYFTFTLEDFKKINSNLRQFPIGNAVSASSAYPGVFNYVTLRDFSKNKKQYRHIFDAGTYDNLGLFTIKRIIKEINTQEKDNREWLDALKLVFLIDSHTDKANRKNAYDPELKNFLSYFVDMSFLDSYDSILTAYRYQLLDTFHAYMNDLGVKHHPLVVFSFDSLLIMNNNESINCSEVLKNKNSDHKINNLCLLHDRLNRISTRFRISNRDESCLKLAAKIIVNRELFFLNSKLVAYSNRNLPSHIENESAENNSSETDYETAETNVEETETSENSESQELNNTIYASTTKLNENNDAGLSNIPESAGESENVAPGNNNLYEIKYNPVFTDTKPQKCRINGKTITIEDLPDEILTGIRNLKD